MIAATITTISALVYSLLTTVPMFLPGKQLNLQSIQAGPVTALVSTVLITIAVWFYGIIDAITCAQRLSARPGGVPPETAGKESEGVKALGAILVVAGVIILLLQFGIGWGYLLRLRGAGALVLSGIYLLLQGTGVLKNTAAARARNRNRKSGIKSYPDDGAVFASFLQFDHGYAEPAFANPAQAVAFHLRVFTEKLGDRAPQGPCSFTVDQDGGRQARQESLVQVLIDRFQCFFHIHPPEVKPG